MVNMTGALGPLEQTAQHSADMLGIIYRPVEDAMSRFVVAHETDDGNGMREATRDLQQFGLMREIGVPAEKAPVHRTYPEDRS